MRLVLLPGLDGTGLLFEPFLRALRRDLDPIVCAYPTHERRTYEQLAPEIERALPSGEPFVLLGESYGGPLSLMVAARRPPGLAGLVLAASFVSCPYPFVPRWAARLVLDAPFQAAPALARLKRRLAGAAARERNALLVRALEAVRPSVLANRVREVVRVDAAPFLTACPVPILYLQGRRDRVVPQRNLSRIQALRPDVRSVRVSAPHMVLQVAPTEAARAVENFVDEHAVR